MPWFFSNLNIFRKKNKKPAAVINEPVPIPPVVPEIVNQKSPERFPVSRELILCWGKKFQPLEIEALIKLATKFHWNINQLNYLIACIAFETGGTFDPAIANFAGSKAVGLIQFMPNTAEGLGTSCEELCKMTLIEQLTYVEKYFVPYFKRTKTLSDMYMAILWPRLIGKPDDAVLFTSDIAYRQNIGLDENNDGKVTKAEASSKVTRYYETGMNIENSTAIIWTTEGVL